MTARRRPDGTVRDRHRATLTVFTDKRRRVAACLPELHRLRRGRHVLRSPPPTNDLADPFADAPLSRSTAEALRTGDHGIVIAAEVEVLGLDSVMRMVCGADVSGTRAVLVDDAALNTSARLDDVEKAIDTQAEGQPRDDLVGLLITGRRSLVEGIRNGLRRDRLLATRDAKLSTVNTQIRRMEWLREAFSNPLTASPSQT